jgi:hydroxymethylpyrimidine pyrophosphatase-like HAD family hydrolase
LRYFCLASDYDGTLARDSHVEPSTVQALKRVSTSGRKLVLATGRTVDSLRNVFPETSLFDLVVAENGAVLYNPSTDERRALSDPPPPGFVRELQRRGVEPLDVGQCIVATWRPHEAEVLDVIRSQGLELHVIFNKDAVMILPSGVNKGTGLRIALDGLGLSPHNTLGIGDAENDHAFLGICECSVAVANALQPLKENADVVTEASHGAGVEEIIAQLLADDLASLSAELKRHDILLGHTPDGAECRFAPYDCRMIVAGPSGGGKSTIVTAILERLIAKQYQVCVLDPEGDYDDFELCVTLGGADRIPAVSEILKLLKTGRESISVNLLGVPLTDRPAYFVSLLPRLQELRAQTGRPHWLIVDESHHLLPAEWDSMSLSVPKDLGNFVLITVHPEHLVPVIRNDVNLVIAIGPNPTQIVREVNPRAGKKLDSLNVTPLEARSGELLLWRANTAEATRVKLQPAKIELRRHKRKYATGELGEDKSFYFRGPGSKMNIRVQNLSLFTQIAEGIDDETWLYHLRQHDYSAWLRDSIKDVAIADEVAVVENAKELSAADSRARILDAIRKQYTNLAREVRPSGLRS